MINTETTGHGTKNRKTVECLVINETSTFISYPFPQGQKLLHPAQQTQTFGVTERKAITE